MTVTPALVKLRAPELSTIDDADPRWVDYIAEAGRRVSATAWGVRTDDGIRLLVAHLMTLSVRSAAAGAGGGAGAGPVVKQDVGPLSVTYANSTSSATGGTMIDPWYALTSYGVEYVSLRKLVFADRVIL